MTVDVTTIGIGQLRSDTLCYVERAASGEVFEVLRRGKPIARLSGVRPLQHLGGARLTLRDLRIRAGRIISAVAGGETFAIEHQGRTVAALAPVAAEALWTLDRTAVS